MNILEFIKNNEFILLFGTITLIQISPIKVNPWSWMFKYIRLWLLGDLVDLRKDFDEERADRIRWNILEFSNSCRNGTHHTREEWTHCIEQLKFYERFTLERSIPNGVIEQESIYLKNLYQERLKSNDFLK